MRWVNWLWVLLYTSGLTRGQKAARRSEIRSDMYEHCALASASGSAAWVLEREVASRLVRGIAGDIAWRLGAGRDAESVVLEGGDPPMPWLSSVFLGAVVVFGAITSAQPTWWGNDLTITLALFAIVGAGCTWFGLYLVRRRFFGPLFIAAGAAIVAWALCWTLVAPVAAVVVALAGFRRAQRLERMLDVGS
jgi:hypothetical protein